MPDSAIENPAAADEAEIRALVADWSKALEAKDLDGLVAGYGPDPVLIDAIPPHAKRDKAAIRDVWARCLPCLPETYRSEHRDLEVTVEGDMALVHGLHHFVPEPADHPCGATWLRITVCFRRIEGAWRVIHEHVSVRFDPMTGAAAFITDPDAG